jgi:hypothetical protein
VKCEKMKRGKILKCLNNSYDTYLLFPFHSRFTSFTEKKLFFLENMSDEQKWELFKQHIFFHYVSYFKIHPEVSKAEILKYYEKRESEERSKKQSD